MIYSPVFLSSLRLVFVGVLTIFFISWFSKKLLHIFYSRRKTGKDVDDKKYEKREAQHNARQNAWAENVQMRHSEKAARYKEEVLIPRENRKKQKKEEEFLKHYGPVWSGEGNMLGGTDSSEDEINSTSNQNDKAAKRRKLPDPGPSADKNIKPKVKAKKVIKLPEEPPETSSNSITVILRTPISTIVKRRFLPSHNFQNILDFMSMIGFSQRQHCLYSSFPRVPLREDGHRTLSDLGFGRRITLNIEDKSDDE